MEAIDARRNPTCGRDGHIAHAEAAISRWRAEILARTDDMVVVRGVNLYPSAIEEILAGLRRSGGVSGRDPHGPRAVGTEHPSGTLT